jgi:hypothetical protein
MWRPSGENATVTRWVCPSDGSNVVWSVSASHTRTDWSFEPDTMRRPSGENATELTQFVCPVNDPNTIWPVSTSHTGFVALLFESRCSRTRKDGLSEGLRTPQC